MNSHAFIYYLSENNGVYIFEVMLEDLEGRIDKVALDLENYIRIKENQDDFSNKEGKIRDSIVDAIA